jgi:hypothetical protein
MIKVLKRILPKSFRDYAKRSKVYQGYRFLWLRKTLFGSPRGIGIEVTDRCNLRCSYCPKGIGVGVDGDDVEFELLKSTVDEAIALGIGSIDLVGFGEPLLYPHLIEAIKYINVRYPGLDISTTTNGILLDERMSKALIESGLKRLTISVNFSSREKYFRHNRADAFDKVVENTKNHLRLLNKDRSNRSPTTSVRVLRELNSESEITAFYDFWQPYLAPNAFISKKPFVNWAGLIPNPTVVSGEQYPCWFLHCGGWMITRSGNALACCMIMPKDDDDNLILGNLKQTPLSDLYSKGRIVQMRRDNLNCDYEQIPTCKKCDAYRSVPNVFVRNPLYPMIGTKWL